MCSDEGMGGRMTAGEGLRQDGGGDGGRGREKKNVICVPAASLSCILQRGRGGGNLCETEGEKGERGGREQ